ncbi:hypothetical protein KBD45_05385, partial [Candidatus Dojkabacteria bacterium]|nr:hypothetical protein [Candidatus Dojkabacteria bacterium]
MKIVPAVLSDSLDDYSKAYRIFEELDGVSKVQLDIMDGVFVKTTSPDFESILKIQTKLDKQVHLMVQEPLPYLDLCMKYGVKEAIVHLRTNYGNVNDFDNYNITVYLGVNPEDNFLSFADLSFKVSGFLLMTVHPGLQGQPFLPEELKKAGYLRNRGFDGTIIVDGSINLETVG